MLVNLLPLLIRTTTPMRILAAGALALSFAAVPAQARETLNFSSPFEVSVIPPAIISLP